MLFYKKPVSKDSDTQALASSLDTVRTSTTDILIFDKIEPKETQIVITLDTVKFILTYNKKKMWNSLEELIL